MTNILVISAQEAEKNKMLKSTIKGAIPLGKIKNHSAIIKNRNTTPHLTIQENIQDELRSIQQGTSHNELEPLKKLNCIRSGTVIVEISDTPKRRSKFFREHAVSYDAEVYFSGISEIPK